MQDRVVQLTKGYVAVISGEDFRRVNRYSWHTSMSRGSGRKHGQPYARARVKGKLVYLHRFIMEVDDPLIQVDHRNQQTLDCRRSNLRKTSAVQNCANRRPPKRNKPCKA